MGKHKKKKPEIRFKGFTDDWEQRKLGNIASKVKIKNNGMTYTETFTNSAEQGIISQRDYFDHDVSNAENIDGYYIVENNDFVYNPRISSSAPVGPINRNTLGRTGVMSPLYTVFRISDNDYVYMEWLFKSNSWHKFMFLNGDSGARADRFSIKDSIFFDMPIPVPCIEEQKQVGEYFSKLDNLITLHQRKLNKLKKVKKSMLGKMFPQNGEMEPQIRFCGFNSTWEQRKLGDMGTTFSGLSGKTKKDFGCGDAKFITYMNVYTNAISDIDMTEKVGIDNKQRTVHYGDILFTTSSETPEEVGMSSVWLGNEENIYLNSFCFGFRPTEILNSYYMAYMLRSDATRKNIIYLAQGISRYNISKNRVMDIEVPITTMHEQDVIGSYFDKLDNLITLHQRKLEKLKKMKKAMLEKMFV